MLCCVFSWMSHSIYASIGLTTGVLSHMCTAKKDVDWSFSLHWYIHLYIVSCVTALIPSINTYHLLCVTGVVNCIYEFSHIWQLFHVESRIEISDANLHVSQHIVRNVSLRELQGSSYQLCHCIIVWLDNFFFTKLRFKPLYSSVIVYIFLGWLV